MGAGNRDKVLWENLASSSEIKLFQSSQQQHQDQKVLCHAHSPRKFHPSNQKSITETLQLPFTQAPGRGRIIPSLQSSNLTMKIWNQLLLPAEKEFCCGESIYPPTVTLNLFRMKLRLCSGVAAPNTPSRYFWSAVQLRGARTVTRILQFRLSHRQNLVVTEHQAGLITSTRTPHQAKVSTCR